MLDVHGACCFSRRDAHQLIVTACADLFALKTIRLSGMSSLVTLDLRKCRGSIDLHIEADSVPETILLSDHGARVYLELPSEFPALRMTGLIDELVVHCTACHPMRGMYRFDGSEGAMLLPCDAIEQTSGIQRYIRVDQSERGLQYKDLRSKAPASDAFWRLIDARKGLLAPLHDVASLDPEALIEFATGNSSTAVEQRQNWLNEITQHRVLCRHLLRLLQNDHPPRAIWALRCMLQCSQRGDDRAADVRHALLTAEMTWGIHSGYYRYPEIDMDDLALMLSCRMTELTRRCERLLKRKPDVRHMETLVSFLAALPQRHPWVVRVVRMVNASVERWHALQKIPIEKSSKEWFEKKTFDWRNDGLLEMMHSARRTTNQEIVEGLMSIAQLSWTPDKKIQAARKLSSINSQLTERLIRSALEAGGIEKQPLKAWAIRYFLGRLD